MVLRYRHVTQFEDYASLRMERIGTTDEFAATVPAAFLVPQWDFMYFIEATSRAGRGVQWPDLAQEAPYVILEWRNLRPPGLPRPAGPGIRGP